LTEAFYRDDWLSIFEGDCRAVLRSMPEASVHAVMTSPPYYGLRDYGVPPSVWGELSTTHEHVWGALEPPRAGGRGNKPGEYSTSSLTNPQRQDSVPRASNAGQFCGCGAWRGQLGLEPSPQLYVAHLVEVLREVRRVLHPEGTVWLNLGDSYAADRGGSEMPAETAAGGVGGKGDLSAYRGRARAEVGPSPHRNAKAFGLKHKDLIGIPWRVAFAAQDDGWWLRRDVVWAKPNPMPESVEDRPTSSHEYVFMLTRSETYFYDRHAVLEPLVLPNAKGIPFGGVKQAGGQNRTYSGNDYDASQLHGRNRRSVWTISTRPYPGAHYAVFPPELVETPVRASTSERGACPECGAQWRRLAAAEDDAETVGWRPGCGHGWGGNPDDLDIIASPLRGSLERPPQPQEHMPEAGRRDAGTRGNRTPNVGMYRRGLGRERADGEGRRFVTRYEQRTYADQMRRWPMDYRGEALDDIARWLGKDAELELWKTASPAMDGAPHPGLEAFRHYHRVDPRGARAIPHSLFETWIERGWLTLVEPPDYSGALTPVRSVVMDVFGGSGTVGAVAQALGRRGVLIDVNGEYLKQQLERASRQFGVGGPSQVDDGTAEHPADSLWAS
jgi:DNA modification methylase